MEVKFKKGWIAKDKDRTWFWYEKKPEINLLDGTWSYKGSYVYLDNKALKIDFKGSWKDSLMEVGEDEVR